MRLEGFSGSSAVQRRLHGVHPLCDTVCLQCWGDGGRFGLVVHSTVATSVCAKVERCSRCWRTIKHFRDVHTMFREDSPKQWEPSQRSTATRQRIHHSHWTVLSPWSPLSKQESCHDSHEALFGLPEKGQEQEMVMGHRSFSNDETGGQALPLQLPAILQWSALNSTSLMRQCYKKVFTAAELSNIFWNQTWTSIRFLQSTFCSKCFFLSKIHLK